MGPGPDRSALRMALDAASASMTGYPRAAHAKRAEDALLQE
jgi:hypothetical protein